MALRLQEGRYVGRVVGQGLTESGETPCVEFTFYVTHRLGAGGLAALPNGGTRRTIRLWLTKDGMAVTRRVLEQLGGVPERISQLDPYALDAVYYSGVEAELECIHREFEGVPREDWSVARTQPQKLSEERIAALDAELGALLKGEQSVSTPEAGEGGDKPSSAPEPAPAVNSGEHKQ